MISEHVQTAVPIWLPIHVMRGLFCRWQRQKSSHTFAVTIFDFIHFHLEDAPPFYKEDLLQEITLMKDLGQHPNIVLLIGACTQREPTALILEYMPYGNLQSFLTYVYFFT